MVAEYALPHPRGLRIADGAVDPLTEAELSRIWAAQSFPPEALTLEDGRRLRIVLPGRPGGGSGPDYRDAVVAIDGVEQRGDLELHVRAPSFYEHGHHADAAYDNVVLHVVYAADGDADTTLRSGRRVPVAAFAPWVESRSDEIQRWLAAPPLWLEPCSDAASRLGSDGVATALTAEGRRRFALKVARMRESVAAQGEEQALWLALLDTLGSGSKDRAAWRRLAEVLPVSHLPSLVAGRSQEDAAAAVYATLLVTAGLFAAPDDLVGFLPRPLSPALRGGSRPASRPERRLRALALLWARAKGDFSTFARRTIKESKGLKQAVAAWTVSDPQGGPALLGPGRARELLLNAVLPFAALDDGLAERAGALLQKLPAADAYGKTAFLEGNLRRGDEGFRAKGALQQQGLLALVSDWCRQGGCGRCPLS
jgi:hypothetical protein